MRRILSLFALVAVLVISYSCEKLPGGKHDKGPHVYISGYYSARLHFTACYWVDGRRYELKDSEGRDTGECDLYVDGNGDVYVCGYAGKTAQACYWKNGKQVLIGESKEDGVAFRMAMYDGHLVICGRDGNRGCIWIDGIRKEIFGNDAGSSAGSEINAVIATDNGLLLAGRKDVSQPKPDFLLHKNLDAAPESVTFASRDLPVLDLRMIGEKLYAISENSFDEDDGLIMYSLDDGSPWTEYLFASNYDFAYTADGRKVAVGGIAYGYGPMIIDNENDNSKVLTGPYASFTCVTVHENDIHVAGVMSAPDQIGLRSLYYWGPDGLPVELSLPFERDNFLSADRIIVK
ncbi:MAG: hypothetical protein MJY56_07685 [Bacteroidales bacterium]|nr:hypothetical protein [Bacteroidales bacterium]